MAYENHSLPQTNLTVLSSQLFLRRFADECFGVSVQYVSPLGSQILPIAVSACLFTESDGGIRLVGSLRIRNEFFKGEKGVWVSSSSETYPRIMALSRP